MRARFVHRRWACVLAAALLWAWAQASPAVASQGPLCATETIAISIDFERAGAASCTITADRRVEIAIVPETRPINDSAWFAFRVSAASAGDVQVVMRYSGGTHRYRPKLSADSLAWRVMPSEAITIAPDKLSAAFSVTVPETGLFIAAQPLETAHNAEHRWDAAIAAGRLRKSQIGRSVQGAPLIALATPGNSARHALVLIARQHPPETPGAHAFDTFFSRLLEDDALAQAFRARVAVLALPVMNPDGLKRGHWRTNAGYVDLNRDWGPFSQPETQAAARAIRHVAQSRPLIGLIDFHATHRDVMYAQPAGDALFPAGLVEDWFARWGARQGAEAPPISRSHTASQANAKTWSRLHFGVSGVTYEVADEADLAAVAATARVSAESYMHAVLALSPDKLIAPERPHQR